METNVLLYSQEFSPSSNVQDPFTISVEESLWRLRFDEEDTHGRFFLRITTEDGSREWIAPVGDVIYKDMFQTDVRRTHRVYLPLWMLDSAGFQGY